MDEKMLFCRKRKEKGMQNGNERFIGVHHGVKRLVNGQASPTRLSIIDGSEVRSYDLESEDAELDLVLGRFPLNWREAKEGEDCSLFPPHHLKKRGQKTLVPEAYERILSGDTVAMILGGSGDALAEALARQAEIKGAKFLRIAPIKLKESLVEYNGETESFIIADLARRRPYLFQPITSRDIDLIHVREIYRRRTQAMKDRISASHRLRQLAIGQAFRDAGLVPQNTVELAYEKLKTTDPGFLALKTEEQSLIKELERAVKKLDIWPLFEQIEGVGPAIAARLISSIIDIKRFDSEAKLKKFCGVAVLDGKFMRRRSGESCGYSNDARGALYLLADQFNRRPDSIWGKKLREYKAKLRETHPEVEMNDNNKKKYSDAHIHKMALWRTVTKFTEWLHREWMRIELVA